MSAVAVDKREERIRRMFGAIAPRYDLLNHLLSLNIDTWWRWRTTKLVPPDLRDASPMLDVCTGTGDLAFAYDEAARHRLPIIGTDFCLPMLLPAKKKAVRGRSRVQFLEADTQRLPFADDQFQLVSVGFGLRNVTDTDRGLREMVRVCKPGGRVAVLEFSQPRHWLLGRMYRFYFTTVLPWIGSWVSKSPDDAYSYLPASVLQFPDGEALAERMRAAGLEDVKWEAMTFGIATLYWGRKVVSVSRATSASAD